MNRLIKNIFFVLLFLFGHTLLCKVPLKILYLIDSYPKITETFIFESIAGMIERGHQVFIYALRHTKEKIKHPSISKHNLDSRVYIKEIPEDLQLYDVILCQFGDLNFRLPEKFLNQNIPYVTCIRGSDITQSLAKKRRDMKNYLMLVISFYLYVIISRKSCVIWDVL